MAGNRSYERPGIRIGAKETLNRENEVEILDRGTGRIDPDLAAGLCRTAKCHECTGLVIGAATERDQAGRIDLNVSRLACPGLDLTIGLCSTKQSADQQQGARINSNQRIVLTRGQFYARSDFYMTSRVNKYFARCRNDTPQHDVLAIVVLRNTNFTEFDRVARDNLDRLAEAVDLNVRVENGHVLAAADENGANTFNIPCNPSRIHGIDFDFPIVRSGRRCNTLDHARNINILPLQECMGIGLHPTGFLRDVQVSSANIVAVQIMTGLQADGMHSTGTRTHDTIHHHVIFTRDLDVPIDVRRAGHTEPRSAVNMDADFVVSSQPAACRIVDQGRIDHSRTVALLHTCGEISVHQAIRGCGRLNMSVGLDAAANHEGTAC